MQKFSRGRGRPNEGAHECSLRAALAIPSPNTEMAYKQNGAQWADNTAFMLAYEHHAIVTR